MLNELTITKATPDSIDSIVMLEQQCFSHPWSRNDIAQYADRNDCLLLTAIINNRVVGYIGMYSVLDEANITNVAVFSQYRSRGIGRALVEAMLESCRSAGLSTVMLEVRSGNLPAISLYEKCGFLTVGRRKNYYCDPVDDAILMTADLK